MTSRAKYGAALASIKSWIAIRFTCHELWALRLSEQFPFFSIFLAGTLWLWALPFLPLLALGGVSMVKWPIMASVFTLVLGLMFLFFVAPWFFRWYFISVSLMMGYTNMATKKREQLEHRLAK
jgi:hypothetical protein